MAGNVRITVSRSPGERPSYGAVCVTCGVPLAFSASQRRAERVGRRHERQHARKDGR